MVKIDKSTIGGRIRGCRRNLGWSQDNLADEMNSSKALISEYETGKTKVPAKKLIKLAEILKTTTGYLLNGEIALKNEDARLNQINSWFMGLENESDREFMFVQMKTTMQWISDKSRKA